MGARSPEERSESVVVDRHRLDLVHLDDATVERHSTRPNALNSMHVKSRHPVEF